MNRELEALFQALEAAQENPESLQLTELFESRLDDAHARCRNVSRQQLRGDSLAVSPLETCATKTFGAASLSVTFESLAPCFARFFQCALQLARFLPRSSRA